MNKSKYLVGVVALVLTVCPFEPLRAAPRCFPAVRFIPLGGELVRDTLTQLVWQQQASGGTMNWDSARIYCFSSGLRLPTVKELRALLDLTVTSGPKINQSAFPETPAENFWTSTPYPSSGNAWKVSFKWGDSSFSDVGLEHWVRCVR